MLSYQALYKCYMYKKAPELGKWQPEKKQKQKKDNSTAVIIRGEFIFTKFAIILMR